MNCTEVLTLIHDWVDGNVTPGDSEKLCAHVRACLQCAKTLETTKDLRRAIERRLPSETAPAGLADRICRAVRASASDRMARARRRRMAVIAHPATGWAAAASLLVMLVVVETGVARDQESNPMSSEAETINTAGQAQNVLVADLVNEYLRYAVDENPAQPEAEFLNVAHVHNVPVREFHVEEGMTFEGKRCSWALNRYVCVYFAKCCGGRRVAYFVLDGCNMPPCFEKSKPDEGARSATYRGHTVAWQRKAGVTYGAVGLMPQEVLRDHLDRTLVSAR